MFEATPAEGLTEIDIVGLKGRTCQSSGGPWRIASRSDTSRCFPVTAAPARARF